VANALCCLLPRTSDNPILNTRAHLSSTSCDEQSFSMWPRAGKERLPKLETALLSVVGRHSVYRTVADFFSADGSDITQRRSA
jgi:hypothetical protein